MTALPPDFPPAWMPAVEAASFAFRGCACDRCAERMLKAITAFLAKLREEGMVIDIDTGDVLVLGRTERT